MAEEEQQPIGFVPDLPEPPIARSIRTPVLESRFPISRPDMAGRLESFLSPVGKQIATAFEAYNWPHDAVRTIMRKAEFDSLANPDYSPFIDDAHRFREVDRDWWEKLADSRSAGETQRIIETYHKEMAAREQLSDVSWYWMMLAGMADPIAWAPLPFLRGGTMLRQAAKGSGAFAGSVAASEYVRYGLDPSVTGEEVYTSIMFGSALGAGVGAVASRFPIREAALKRHKAEFHRHESVQQNSSVRAAPQERKKLRDLSNAKRNLNRDKARLSAVERDLPESNAANIEMIAVDMPTESLDMAAKVAEMGAHIADYTRRLRIYTSDQLDLIAKNHGPEMAALVRDKYKERKAPLASLSQRWVNRALRGKPRKKRLEELQNHEPFMVLNKERLAVYEPLDIAFVVGHEMGHLLHGYARRRFHYKKPVPEARLFAIWKKARPEQQYDEWVADQFGMWVLDRVGIPKTQRVKKRATLNDGFAEWADNRATLYGKRQTQRNIIRRVEANEKLIARQGAEIDELRAERGELNAMDDMETPADGEAQPLWVSSEEAETLRVRALEEERGTWQQARQDAIDLVDEKRREVAAREAMIANAGNERAAARYRNGNFPTRGARPSLEELQTELGQLQSRVSLVDEKLNELDMVLNADPEDFGVLPTGLGVERAMESTAQFPWYRGINNKLLKILPVHGKEFSMMMGQMVGPPGVAMRFAKEGKAMGPNVWNASKLWNVKAHTAWRNMMDEYYRMADLGEAPSDFHIMRRDTTQAIGRHVRNARNLARKAAGREELTVDPHAPMSIQQFEDEVGKVLFGVEPVNEHVAAAARHWEQFYSDFADAMEEMNMFAAPRQVEQRIRAYKARERRLERLIRQTDNDNVRETSTRNLNIMRANRASAEHLLDELTSNPDRYFRRENYGMPRVWLDQLLQQEPYYSRLREVIRRNLLDRGSEVYIGERSVNIRGPGGADELEGLIDEIVLNLRKQIDFDDVAGTMRGKTRQDYYQERLTIVERDLQRATADGDEAMMKRLGARVEILEKALENPAAGGAAPSQILTRTLGFVPNRELVEFLDTNVARVSQHYLSRMAPLIETARKFGDMRAADRLDDVWISTLEAIDNLPKAKQGAAIKAAREAREDFIKVRDIVQGNFGIPKNPDSWTVQVMNAILGLTGMQWMGKALFANMADMGVMSQIAGWRPLFRTWAKFFDKDSFTNLARDEVVLAGMAMETALPMRFASIVEHGGPAAGGWKNAMGRVNNAISRGAGRFYFMNGVNTWTDWSRQVGGALIQSRIIEFSRKWLAGELTEKQITQLTKTGLTRTMAKDFVEQWTAAGSQARQRSGITMYLANTPGWKNETAVRQFRQLLVAELDNHVITPGPASKPTMFISTPMGRIFGQFRGFGMDATQKILMSGLQRRDKEAAIMFSSMIAAGILIDHARRPDFIDLTTDELIMRGIEISGVTGVFADINMMLEQASGGELGLRPMFGMRPVVDSEDNWARQVGGVAGAAPQTWLNLMWAFTSEEATNSERARAIRFMFPFQNHFMISSYVKELERELGESMDLVTE